MRRIAAITVGFLVLFGMTSPAWACGGLVNPNGTVSLLRTSTFVGYVDGVEHYVTSFEFAGGGAEFGSIIPLPGVPTKVERAGDWTLQRLVQEVAPPVRDLVLEQAAGAANFDSAKVLLETRIDALDITILEGGGDEVGRWAKENGFALTPDAPEILDFYAARSPIFMAARFDPSAAAEDDQSVGDGTPIHLTIPTPNPWVPLRILTLGVGERSLVEADVFLLTEGRPQMLPEPVIREDDGMILERSVEASKLLLSDLRSDKGMDWIPASDMWFSYLRINTKAGDLSHDLAIEARGIGQPSPVAAGLVAPGVSASSFPEIESQSAEGGALLWLVLGIGIAAGSIWWMGRPWSASD
ncbi:MAG: DUF2330 domain-containing protein [Actinobacteria bacterium]|nr:DUF2330 domain-containing protein [Actinomycetota bacterium]